MHFVVLSLLMYLIQNFSNKEFGKKETDGGAVLLMQNGMCVLFSALVLAACGGIRIMSASMMLLAVLFGITYLSTVFLLLCAFQCGSMGGSTLLCNTGMFISAVFGILCFDDKFTFSIGMGMVCMLASVILSVPKDEHKTGFGGIRWFLIALASGLSNGVVASVKRIAVSINANDTRVFLFWGFLVSSIIAVGLIAHSRDSRTACQKSIKNNPSIVLCGVGAGVGTAGANLFQMEALRTVSSAIVYPFTAGFLIVVLNLISLLVYKETKLKVSNVVAIVLCIAAIIFTNI